MHALVGQILREVLIRTLRGSLLIGGAIMLLSSTGTWKYLASSFSAHDFGRAASVSALDGLSPVAVVAISDQAYEHYFAGRSPLDRRKLLELLKVIDEAAPAAKGVLVDLDLAPVQGSEQGYLLKYLSERPARWILAEPVTKAEDDTHTRKAWRDSLCQAGVRLGLPYLPSEFGYVSSSHQFMGALSQVALDEGFNCARLAKLLTDESVTGGETKLMRMSAPMSPTFVDRGVVLPFQGDLSELAAMIKAANPQWIVLGGTWGTGDVMNTPLGERYGAQLHAAALEGQLQGRRQAPYVAQLFSAWVSLALIGVLLAAVYQLLATAVLPWADKYPGHQFLAQRLWPIGMALLVFACVLLISEVLARVHARFGFWLPTATIAGVVFGSVLFVWNWGLNKIISQKDAGSAWKSTVVMPIQTDWSAIKVAACTLIRTGESPAAAGDGKSAPDFTRARAALELLLASASLSAQTVLPAVTFVAAFHRTL
jgi:hypothetical protein